MQHFYIDFSAITPKKINDLAKENARLIVKEDRVKTHQIRNIFSYIERMRIEFKQLIRLEEKDDDFQKLKNSLTMRLLLLKPKIAYAAGRSKGFRNRFFPLVEAAIEGVEMVSVEEKIEAYQKFFALMESIVAYHKFFDSEPK
ncbi:MAG: type III-A CRISPR-associated protein Csm2 [Bacteroidota bacterium]